MGHDGSGLEVMGMGGLVERGDMSWSEEEVSFMNHAIQIAELGRGQVRPNPLVGCVIVKDGEIIAEGWHDHLGGLHAEQMAISDAESRGISTNGATAYITLEPCNHHGRTPPCTEALLWAGITTIVVAHSDPNPTVRGNGIEYLRDQGFEVRCGLLEDEAAVQMQSFLNWCKTRKPLVTLKMATDLNGAVDDHSVDSHRFTSKESLDAVHRLRRDCDTVLIGVETVIRDNPSLTIRRVELGTGRQPLRIVLDRSLRIPLDSNIINDEHETLILHNEGEEETANMLSNRDNVKVMQIKTDNSHSGVDLNHLLSLLGDLESQEILVEGGPETARRFLDSGLIDRAIIIQSNAEFKQPLQLGITDEDFTNNGLINIGQKNWGEDVVKFWSRKELQWPNQNWP